jgi:hypothetical protein
MISKISVYGHPGARRRFRDCCRIQDVGWEMAIAVNGDVAARTLSLIVNDKYLHMPQRTPSWTPPYQNR